MARPSTVLELRLTIAGDVTSFGAPQRTALTAGIQTSASCHEPACFVALRVAAGSITVAAVLTIPDAPAGGDATAVATIVTNVQAAAALLVAQPPATLTASLGVTVEAAAPTVSVGRAIVPLVVAPPPPSALGPSPPASPDVMPPSLPPPMGSNAVVIALAAGGGALVLVVGAALAVLVKGHVLCRRPKGKVTGFAQA